MKHITLILLGWLALIATSRADETICIPLKNGAKFVRCGEAVIQADIPESDIKSLASGYPISKILSGVLDQDTVNDYVVSATEHTNSGLVDRVIILKGKPGGGYEELAKSSHIEYGKTDVEIRNHSLFIIAFNNSMNDSDSETYQFKYITNDFVLIGAERNVAHLVDGSRYKTSYNFLTGEKIEYSNINGKLSEVKSKIQARERGIQYSKKITLEEFSR